MSEIKFPKVYELNIIYLDENDRVHTHTEKYDDLEECTRSIKHFRVKKDYEIMKYEINVQRVLI